MCGVHVWRGCASAVRLSRGYVQGAEEPARSGQAVGGAGAAEGGQAQQSQQAKPTPLNLCYYYKCHPPRAHTAQA